MALEPLLNIEADAIYIAMVSRPIAYSKEFAENVVGDFADDGTLVGIDIQCFSQCQPSEFKEAGSDAWSNVGISFAHPRLS